MDFSQERILNNFYHDKETGTIYRKRNNTPVLSKDEDGYIVVAHMLNKSNDRMRGARLVWVMYNGEIPAGMVVDHKNRIRDDNRLENLRLATQKDNAANAERKDCIYTSKYKGVQLDSWGRWKASIQTDGVTTCLGLYDSEEAAAYAYNQEAEKRYGEFAVLNDVPAVDLSLFETIKDRDYFSEKRRGLPKHLVVVDNDFVVRAHNKTYARFKPQHKEDALFAVQYFNEQGVVPDLRTDITKYNKYGLPYNIFPCSTGVRATFIKDGIRYHVGTFKNEQEALPHLIKKQDEVGYIRKVNYG